MKEREVTVGLVVPIMDMRNTGGAVELGQKAEFHWEVLFELPMNHQGIIGHTSLELREKLGGREQVKP